MMRRSEALTTFNCNSLLKVKNWFFLGTLFAIKNNMPPTVSISCSESNLTFIPKYFSNEKELESILGSFVKSLFFEMSKLNGKIHYCEATPSNMLHVDFIHSIIPDAYFLHITRNPIGVAFSMAQKNRLWAPNNVDDVVHYLSPIYEKLIKMEEYAIKNNIEYKRIKLEECSSKNFLIDINTFLGIDNKFDDSVNFVSSKVDYWADKYDPKIIQQYNNKLSKYINHFGY